MALTNDARKANAGYHDKPQPGMLALYYDGKRVRVPATSRTWNAELESGAEASSLLDGLDYIVKEFDPTTLTVTVAATVPVGSKSLPLGETVDPL